jgi:arylsulfatase A-like enzyme
MIREFFLPVIRVLGFLFLGGTACGQAEPGPDQPNIIVFLTDDQGFGDGHIFGHPYVKTPNIDRLAREGTTFTQFYATSPVCSPSRASLYTGKFPAELGIHHIFIRTEQAKKWGNALYMPDVPTVSDLLKSRGYATAHYGKWHLTSGGVTDAPTAADYGIDEIKIGGGDGGMQGPRWTDRGRYYMAESSGLFVDAAIDFIDRHKDGPFFVNIWTLIPHSPLNPTSEELDEYKDLKISPDDFQSWMREYVKNANDPQNQMKVYCAAMTGLDNALGRLLDHLDQTGMAENTLIVFTSDNGPEDYHIGDSGNAGMGSPGISRGRKRSLYDGGLRVPFLVRWPGVTPAGSVDSSSVMCMADLLPTLASIAGVPCDILNSASLSGEDVSRAWEGRPVQRDKPMLWEWRWDIPGDPRYTSPRLAIRDGDWKLLCRPDGSGQELYNVIADSEERSNVVGEHPEIAGRLQSIVTDWSRSLP